MPDFITDNLRLALPRLGQRLKGFDHPDALLTGPETRSSAPVRILRNQMSREYLAREKAGADRMELEHYTLGSLRRAVFDGDTKTGSLMAGQVAGMLHEIKPLRQIFEELNSGCAKRLAELEL